MGERLPFNWPPEMEAAYRKWIDDNEAQGCLCLTCLNARLRNVRRKLAAEETGHG